MITDDSTAVILSTKMYSVTIGCLRYFFIAVINRVNSVPATQLCMYHII